MKIIILEPTQCSPYMPNGYCTGFVGTNYMGAPHQCLGTMTNVRECECYSADDKVDQFGKGKLKNHFQRYISVKFIYLL